MPRAQRALAMTPLQGVPRAGRCGHRPLRKRNKRCNGRATARVAPTKALQEVQVRRADRGIRPYGSVTRGAMGGRPRGSPLRKRYKGCGKAGGVEPRPYERVTRGAGKNPPVTASPCQPPLGKRAEGTGMRIATTSLRTGLAMTPLTRSAGAAGHMGPALQGIFVGQGPRALPGVRYKVGGWGL